MPVTSNGVVDLAALTRAIKKAERPLVSVMLANNETGVIQPIAQIAEIVHAASGVLHVDAVQGAGRIDCKIGALGADLVSISSHKLGGPQGAGALVSRGDVHIGEPLIKGGGQERGQRAGTENVAAIVGFGAACETAKKTEIDCLVVLRDRLEAGIMTATPSAMVFRWVRAASSEHHAVYGSRPEGGNCNNCLRSQWYSGFVRFGVFVWQGPGIKRADGNGRRPSAYAGCRARQPWLEHQRGRSRSVP